MLYLGKGLPTACTLLAILTWRRCGGRRGCAAGRWHGAAWVLVVPKGPHGCLVGLQLHMRAALEGDDGALDALQPPFV